MRTIAIVPNTAKDSWCEHTQKIANILSPLGVEILILKKYEEQLEYNSNIHFVNINKMMKQAELILSLGGDGTLMRTAKYAALNNIPILGVNIGHLGYMVELELFECERYLKQVVEGKFTYDKRMMLSVEVLRDGKRIATTVVLNDAFIAKGIIGRMITTQVFFDGVAMNTYTGDGVVIATPTGSTAYSLSAGGSVLEPQSQNILVTPICPHTLSSRPIVMSSDKVITVIANAQTKDCCLVCDGEIFFKLQENDVVRIEKSKDYLKLVRLKNRGFYDILREKLSERGNEV